MLSTPILNPPQCAILGMHAITERAVVEKGEMWNISLNVTCTNTMISNIMI
jgi:pyruvate/2-oxoglutarate dehydrogenase complex dihydrolipoamide acyltransferase (E2) component